LLAKRFSNGNHGIPFCTVKPIFKCTVQYLYPDGPASGCLPKAAIH
jgi:hypothetical protein